MIVKQVWSLIAIEVRQFEAPLRKFYESPSVMSVDAMWRTLESIKDEKGRVPLIVDPPADWWESKQMRGKTYSLVPIDEIMLIESQEFEDNERIFLSDHIRGSTSEQ